MDNLGTFTVSSYLPPSSPLQYSTGGGYEYIRIINNSPYQLSVDLYGSSNAPTVSEFYIQDIPAPTNYSGQIKVTPSINITTVSHAQSNSLTIEGFYKGELSAPISVPIPQQAVTATASGKPIFTAHFGVGSSANAVQTLNVFNPPNSGVNMTFHSAKVFTNSAGVPQGVLTFIAGGDLNLVTAVSIGSHIASSKPPVSAAHATFDDVAVGHGGTVIDNTRLPGSTSNGTIDLLAFPDTVTLFPGTNLLIVCSDTTSGHVIELLLKWSEDIAVPAAGGVLTGMAITTLVNQGNPGPTPIVTASPSGDGATATLINNNGTETLGDATNPGKLIVAGASNPAIDLSNASIIQGLKLLAGSITRISKFTGTANTTPTFFNHGLGDIPDIVMIVGNGTSSTLHTFFVDYATLTSTQVKITNDSAGGTPFVALAIKF